MASVANKQFNFDMKDKCPGDEHTAHFKLVPLTNLPNKVEWKGLVPLTAGESDHIIDTVSYYEQCFQSLAARHEFFVENPMGCARPPRSRSLLLWS